MTIMRVDIVSKYENIVSRISNGKCTSILWSPRIVLMQQDVVVMTNMTKV